MKKENKTLLFGLGAVAAFLFFGGGRVSAAASGSGAIMFPPNGDGVTRGQDSWGSGKYGASRSGGRTHAGTDYAVVPGQDIYAPFHGELVRVGFAYNDGIYRLIELQGLGVWSEFACKIMYINNWGEIGQVYQAGDIVGTAQDIRDRYSDDMVAHIHFELYHLGVNVNPENYIQYA